MSSENKAVVRRFFEIEDQERRIPLELCAPDFTAYLPGAPPMNTQAFVERENLFYDAFSDIKHLIGDMVAEDDRVAMRMTLEATHTGDFMGIPASNTGASVSAFGILRVADGKIAEFWGLPDMMTLMQQLGAMPAPESTGDA